MGETRSPCRRSTNQLPATPDCTVTMQTAAKWASVQTKYPTATQTLPRNSPWKQTYSCDGRKIQPFFGLSLRGCVLTHMRTNRHFSNFLTERVKNSTCLTQSDPDCCTVTLFQPITRSTFQTLTGRGPCD